MAERFIDTLRSVHAALEKADATTKKQVRAAAEAALPKWQKSGNIKELSSFADALPKGLGADVLAAIAQEIALRGLEWAKSTLFTCFSEHVKALEGVGAEA